MSLLRIRLAKILDTRGKHKAAERMDRFVRRTTAAASDEVVPLEPEKTTEAFDPSTVDLTYPLTSREQEDEDLFADDPETLAQIRSERPEERRKRAERQWKYQQRQKWLSQHDWASMAQKLYGRGQKPWISEFGGMDLGHGHTTSHWMLPDSSLTGEFGDHYRSAQELETGEKGRSTPGWGMGDKWTNHSNMFAMGTHAGILRVRNIPGGNGNPPEVWLGIYGRPNIFQCAWVRRHGREMEQSGGKIKFDVFSQYGSGPEASGNTVKQFEAVPWEQIFPAIQSADGNPPTV